MARTFAEKLFGLKAGHDVSAGDIVSVEPDWVMSHDNAAAISATFRKTGAANVRFPERIVIILDHEIPAPKESSATNHKEIRAFVKEQGIQHFFDINYGICHQVFVEQGFAMPGQLVVGSDSHTTTYGALGAFAAGIGRSEAAAIWATGELWFQVPDTMQITLQGRMPDYLTPKDVALNIIGRILADGADYRSVEFRGDAVDAMSIPERMVLCNMAAEMGAKNGYVPPDDTTLAFLKNRAQSNFTPLYSDPGADYVEKVDFDIASMSPAVSRPHTVDNHATIDEVAGTPIDQALIGTCTNGRLEDLRAAARILKGRRVKVRTLIIPASWQVYRDAMHENLLDVFVEAGAVILNPGCGPCLGAHQGVMAPGEVTFSTANRNFKGRMGCRDAEIYLGSPLSVAASAVTGEITHPGRFL
ncbi:MAG: 3-isopropylmalate dehydratase large subunit [Acidobacteriota bacterium]|jgi:homoaconitate hydratase family protein|nr:3-isopropylmalate dehydratase large subunit [Acidobacteriota bacterium]